MILCGPVENRRLPSALTNISSVDFSARSAIHAERIGKKVLMLVSLAAPWGLKTLRIKSLLPSSAYLTAETSTEAGETVTNEISASSGPGCLPVHAAASGRSYQYAWCMAWSQVPEWDMIEYSKVWVPCICAPGVAVMGPAAPCRVPRSSLDNQPTQRSSVSAIAGPLSCDRIS